LRSPHILANIIILDFIQNVNLSFYSISFSVFRKIGNAIKKLPGLCCSEPRRCHMNMFEVGPSLGPQFMAEIGDVRRFHSKKALVAFAGIDTPPYQSGQLNVRGRNISKHGSPALRRTLFLIMFFVLQHSPVHDPIFQFMAKKRSEGKPYKGVFLSGYSFEWLFSYTPRRLCLLLFSLYPAQYVLHSRAKFY